MKFKPVIKWSGSKRSQASEILKRMPSEIGTYYEPFVGGGSIVRAVIDSDIKVTNYKCSDANGDLIDLWNMIKTDPLVVSEGYSELWNEMNSSNDVVVKRDYFYKVRKRFNESKNPIDFMFIMRTTTNGMPRYNLKGEFNNSFHITRCGIQPKTLHDIILEWSDKINENNVTFEKKCYSGILSNDGDLLYIDPPYANTRGMYHGTIDYILLWEWLKQQDGKYILSFDGTSGNIDSTYNVPIDVYSTHEYLLSGNSSFKRTTGNSNDSIVYESLYLK